MGIFANNVGWGKEGEPLALTAIRWYGALKALAIPGREQFVAGNKDTSSYNNYDQPEAVRVIANPKIATPDILSLWVEERISVDGPGSYYDEVGFRHLGSFSKDRAKEIVTQFRERSAPSELDKMLGYGDTNRIDV